MCFFSIGSWFLWFLVISKAMFGNHYGRFYLDFNSVNEMIFEYVLIILLLLTSIIFLIVFVKKVLMEIKEELNEKQTN